MDRDWIMQAGGDFSFGKGGPEAIPSGVTDTVDMIGALVAG
jgi:hypothetical protein